MNIRACMAVILSLTWWSAAEADTRGAKAIFIDTTSGAVVQGSTPQPNKPRSQSPRRSAGKAEKAPEAIGLMYYMELVSPSGQKSRVTADRTFQSGERILLHVQSNVDGDVAVFQRESDGRQTQLFPDDRVNGGSALIKKNADMILPSPTAWFRFDDQSGTEQLTIVLTPRSAGTSARRALAVPMASLDPIEPGSGSKGLLLETESSGPEQATYAVRPVQNGQAAERIIIPIMLKHQ